MEPRTKARRDRELPKIGLTLLLGLVRRKIAPGRRKIVLVPRRIIVQELQRIARVRQKTIARMTTIAVGFHGLEVPRTVRVRSPMQRRAQEHLRIALDSQRTIVARNQRTTVARSLKTTEAHSQRTTVVHSLETTEADNLKTIVEFRGHRRIIGLSRHRNSHGRLPTRSRNAVVRLRRPARSLNSLRVLRRIGKKLPRGGRIVPKRHRGSNSPMLRKIEIGKNLSRGSRIVPKRHQGSNSLMRRKLGSQKTETVRKQRPGQTATRTFLVPRPSRAVRTARRINSEGTKKAIPTRIRTKTRTNRLSIAEDGSISPSKPVPQMGLAFL